MSGAMCRPLLGRLAVKQCTVRTFSSLNARRQSLNGVASTGGSKGTHPSESAEALTWPNFFRLRKQESRINTVSSVFTAFVGSNISWAYLSTMEIDLTQTIFGFDPLAVTAAALVASGGLGYLFGPLLGSNVFRLKNNRILSTYNLKNREFLEHIKKNRVDASSQSFSNPIPDYYGEKIGSLKEYRQWLRDCHAHTRKAKEFL